MTFASASTSLTDVDVATVGRVFLVGCPRSGTTLLQSLLAAHSQVASLPCTERAIVYPAVSLAAEIAAVLSRLQRGLPGPYFMQRDMKTGHTVRLG